MFKDIIINEINKYKNIILWLDYKDNFSNYYYEFEYFLNNGYNIIFHLCKRHILPLQTKQNTIYSIIIT